MAGYGVRSIEHCQFVFRLVSNAICSFGHGEIENPQMGMDLLLFTAVVGADAFSKQPSLRASETLVKALAFFILFEAQHGPPKGPRRL